MGFLFSLLILKQNPALLIQAISHSLIDETIINGTVFEEEIKKSKENEELNPHS